MDDDIKSLLVENMKILRNFSKTAPVIGFEDPFERGGQVLKVVQGKLVLEAVVQDWSSYEAETSFFQ